MECRRTKDTGNLPYYCIKCGEEFKTLIDLNEHECEVEKVICKCPKCKEEFDITTTIQPFKESAIKEFVKKIIKSPSTKLNGKQNKYLW